MRKHLGAAALTLCLATAGLFGGLYSQNVYAEDTSASTESDDVIDESESIFDEVGIDNTEIPDGYDEDSEENPNGAEYKTMFSVEEIFDVSGSGGVLYGNDNDLDDSFDTFMSAKNTDSNITTQDGAFRASAAGCFDGKGRKSDVAIVTLLNGQLSLSVTGSGNKFENVDSVKNIKYLTGIDSSYSHQNLLEITTGDYNCDGLDEIAVVLPQTSSSDTNARVAIYKLKASTLDATNMDNWNLVWNYYLPRSASYWNMYDLCTSDVDGDGSDDLIVSWGKATLASGATATSAKLDSDNTLESESVLLMGGKIDMLQTESEISYGDDPLCRVAFTAGDIDGDGNKEIIMGGQFLTEAKSDNKTRCLSVYHYDSGKGTLVSNGIIDTKVVEDGNGYDTKYLSMPDMKANITVAPIYGAGKDTCVYLDSVLYTYGSSSTFQIADELDDANTKNADGISISHPFYSSAGKTYSEYNANGSYFAGGTNAGILVERISSGNFKKSDLLYEKYATGLNSDKKADLTIDSKQISSNTTGVSNGSFATLVDTDGDSTVMRYTGNHYLTYSDPTVLAVMASSPYFKDVAENADGGDDMVDNCETSFGKSHGTESYSGNDCSVDIGYFHEFSADFIPEISELTWYFGIGFSGGSTDTDSNEKEYTVTFSSSAGTDCVALYSIPEAIYEYEVEYIDSEGNQQTKTVNVDIPYQPVTQTITLETYDKIQKNYENRLPEISGKAIKSVAGDPSSYPSSASGYKNAEVYDGSWAGTAYNSEGSVSQEISISGSHTYEETMGGYLSNTLMVGNDTYKGGVSVDASFLSVSGRTTSEGIDVSGTVANMPEEAEQYGYYFAWKLMTYDYQVNKDSSFPVVTYLTRDVTTPPALPEDFSQDKENTTDTQIGLSWTYSDSASSFDIYRKSKFSDGESNIKVGTVKAGDYTLQKDSDGEIVYDEDGNTIKEYSFVEKSLSPYTEYEYSIQVNRNKAPSQSIPSASLKVRTNAKYQPKVKISDEELTLYPDTVKTVTVTAQDSDEFTYNNKSFQWQKYDKETDSWTDVSGKTSSKYKFVNNKEEDAGKYRCRLNTEISVGGSVFCITAYSAVLNVDFSKRDVKFGDVTYTENGDSTTFTIGITNNGDGAKSQPSGQILFTLSDGQTETYKLSNIDVSNNTAAVTFDSLETGAYELTTEYFGQSSIFRDRQNEDKFIYMKDMSRGTWISSQKSYDYHENIMDSLKLYYLEAGNNGKTVRTDISDQITKVEILAPGATSSCAAFTISDDSRIAYIPTTGDLDSDTDIGTIADTGRAVIKITYGQNQSVTRTVNACKADITLYLDDAEATVNTDITKITRDDIKVKGDGYTEGDNPFTYASDHKITGVSDAFSESCKEHFNIGMYTLSGDLLGNLHNNSSNDEESTINAENVLPGKYALKVRCGNSYDSWDVLSKFYNITLDSSSFVLYGDAYTVNVTAGMIDGKQVGSVTMVSPDETDDLTGMVYQGGTTLTLKATPISNYYIQGWQISSGNETKIVPATNDKLVYTVQGESTEINITAIFAVTENHFTYKVIGGGTLECMNSQLTEDALVVSGTELTFKATADPGYEFVEWRNVTVGKSTAVSQGTVSEDGTVSTNTFTMGTASTVLYAVFQRQKADITLSDHLVAYYINSSEIDSNVPDGLELKVNNDNKVAKGATVIIRPEAGYKVSSWKVTEVDESAIEQIEGDTAIRFVVPDDADTIEVNADAKAGVYAISVSSEDTDGSSDAEIADFTILLDKTEVAADSESLDQVSAGTTLEVTVTPKRGYLFDHWIVNNKVVEGTSLVYASNVTKNMNIVAVCKPLKSYTLENHLDFTSKYYGNTESIVCDIYNSYGVKIQTLTYNNLKTYDETDKPVIYEGDTVSYTIENGNDKLSYVEVNGTKISDLTGGYKITDITEDQKVIFYFQASIYYKVNVVNDTDYTLLDAYDTQIGDAVYVHPEEIYNFRIVDYADNKTTIHNASVTLNGAELEIDSGYYRLKGISSECTLVIKKTATYHITSETELLEYLNALKTDSNLDAVLENDITVSTTADLPDSVVLSGTFDGNGHMIKNGYGSARTSPGLFREISETGQVKNLKMSDWYNYCPAETCEYGGCIASKNAGIIENCIVDSCTLFSTADEGYSSKIGSVAGNNTGTIKNCIVKDNTLTRDYGFIASYNSGSILTCYVKDISYYNYDTYVSDPTENDYLVRDNSGGTLVDCYYVNGSVVTVATGYGINARSMSAEKCVWLLNHANGEAVWGVKADGSGDMPSLIPFDSSLAVPVAVTFTGYESKYICPGPVTIPTKDASGIEAWTDGKACYSAGTEFSSVTSDITFTQADIQNVYIVSVAVTKDSVTTIQYFKTLKEALTYAGDNASGTVSIAENVDLSVTDALTIAKGVSLTLNNTTVTIEDGASLTNRGTLTIPSGSKMYNYGTFKNSDGATLDIGTKDASGGTFTNSGAFANAGTVTDQSLIVCKPHSYADKEVITQPTSDTTGEKIQICAACLTERTVTIPKNDPDPDKSKVSKVEISVPSKTSYNADTDAFDITGAKAIADLSDGSTATVTNLIYKINGFEIKAGDSIKEFLDTAKICDSTGFVLTVTASAYEDLDGAVKTCDLTITGNATGHQLTYVEAVTATSTGDGNKAYYICDRCGKYFKADTKEEVTKDDVIITKESVVIAQAQEAAKKAQEAQAAAEAAATQAAAEKDLAKEAAQNAIAAQAAAEAAAQNAIAAKAAVEEAQKKVEAAQTAVEAATQKAIAAQTAAEEAAKGSAASKEAAEKALEQAGIQKAEAEKALAEAKTLKAEAEKTLEEANAKMAEAEAIAKKAQEQADAKKASSDKDTGDGDDKEIREIAAKYGVSDDTLKVTESTLTGHKSDSDVKGSTFSDIALMVSKSSKKAIALKWQKVAGADGYMIFGNLAGNKYQLVKLATVPNSQTSYTHTNLKSGKYYKYSMIAYKLVNGKAVTLAVSKMVFGTTLGGKYGRITSVSVKKVGKSKSRKVTLKVNKTAKISVTEKHSKKIARYRKLSYESSNTKVAAVTSSGKIKALKKGKCYIYIYAQNGVYKRVLVTVK